MTVPRDGTFLRLDSYLNVILGLSTSDYRCERDRIINTLAGRHVRTCYLGERNRIVRIAGLADNLPRTRIFVQVALRPDDPRSRIVVRTNVHVSCSPLSQPLLIILL